MLFDTVYISRRTTSTQVRRLTDTTNLAEQLFLHVHFVSVFLELTLSLTVKQRSTHITHNVLMVSF
jgi:hypothetical protein